MITERNSPDLEIYVQDMYEILLSLTVKDFNDYVNAFSFTQHGVSLNVELHVNITISINIMIMISVCETFV